MAGNNAVNVNAPTAVEHITTHGSDWLWAVFAVMLASDLGVFVWSLLIPRGQRVFHHLSMIILSTAAIAYFAMASDLGYAAIATEFANGNSPAGISRQIWYARYIDWVITTPALLLTLVLASGLPLSDIITLAFFDLVMIITGLIGALVQSTYKWGFYTFGCVALFYIWWVLAGPARTSALALGPAYQKTFTSSAALLSFLWLLYPIAWGLSDGGNVISSDSEMVFYGVLDILAKPVFCFIHLFLLGRLDLTALQLSSSKFTTSAVATAYDPEKNRHTNHGARDAAIGAGVGAAAEHHYAATTTTGAKQGFFSRKGKYDAGATAPHVGGAAPITGINGTNDATVGSVDGPADPRLSQVTAVSRP